jgi:hypothetical protein
MHEFTAGHACVCGAVHSVKHSDAASTAQPATGTASLQPESGQPIDTPMGEASDAGAPASASQPHDTADEVDPATAALLAELGASSGFAERRSRISTLLSRLRADCVAAGGTDNGAAAIATLAGIVSRAAAALSATSDTVAFAERGKYLRVRQTNPTFASRTANSAAAIELLKMAGFQHDQGSAMLNANEEWLHFPERGGDVASLWLVRDCLSGSGHPT